MTTHNWPELEALGQSRPTISAVTADPDWLELSEISAPGIYFNFSHHQLNPRISATLVEALGRSPFEDLRQAMISGDAINLTEQRAVGHCRIRTSAFVADDATHAAMRAFTEAVRSGAHRGATGQPIEHVVNIGIGGSDFGPRLMCHALADLPSAQFCMHFVANVDGADLARVLRQCDPERTLFVIVSKTFTTLETLENARHARDWLRASLGEEADLSPQLAAVTVATDRAEAFGVNPHAIFGFSEDIGGRFSLWSSVGLAIALHLGYDSFRALLAGAERMDQHFVNASPAQNIPIMMALIAFWYGTIIGAESGAIIPYSQRLELLPSFLQQLEMESLGKSASREGDSLEYQTGGVLWGQPGTNAQHAFFQLLHQGRVLIPVDFIGFIEVEPELQTQQDLLNQNMLAQISALAYGDFSTDPHRHYPGNRPSSLLLFDRFDAEALGQLVALYEHKVFTLAALWNINAFDQWGVELGKRLAKAMGEGATPEPSIERILKRLSSAP
ncbi:MAG: glucose-6-phosphate isomerase [Pseudomonadales bacterium]